MTFLLVGGDSEIGTVALSAMLANRRSVCASTRHQDRARLSHRLLIDLDASEKTWQIPRGTTSSCILAAVSRLKACADDPAGTRRINVDRTLALIDWLLTHGSHILFLSTNQVFDGRSACVPVDSPLAPISEYGRQKAAVEHALWNRMWQAPVAILRLGKVLSPSAPLLTGWRDSLRAGRPIEAFGDMVMAPTPVGTVARAIDAVMGARATGIWQLTGPADINYATVAHHIAQRIGAPSALVHTVSARTAGVPVGGTVANTTLDSRRLATEFDITVPDPWRVVNDTITES